MQVQPKAGLTFASALRALLRQDPDVIMLGEIRDSETLEAALQAAMTGHLVLSTVHANSCAKTVARLLDMGAPAYLVSTSVVGIVAQRLVRALCPHCKEEATPTAEDIELLGSDKNEDGSPLKLYAPKGCPKCDHSGFKGRLGIYEIMSINRDIAKLIDEVASTIEIEDAAIQNGMRLLSDDAKRLIRLGITTTKEVRRTLGFHGAS
jgi:type IV pilus assembly protein PilB